jgi:hypothetical protein
LKVPTSAVSTRTSRNWELFDSLKKDISGIQKFLVSTVKTPMHYNNSLIQFTAFVSLTE